MIFVARSSAIAVLALLALSPSHPLGAADATSAAAAVDPVAASPRASARGHDQYGDWADLTVKGVVQRFRLIPAGTFTMGSPPAEHGHELDEVQHLVTLTKCFWLADSECTHDLWHAVMTPIPDPPDYSSSSTQQQPGDRAQDEISWSDCTTFLDRMNHQVVGLEARFPTEAEWEYACRAGTTGPDTAASVEKMAWYGNRRDDPMHPVKLKVSNAWGLFDMQGNVVEYCQDWYGDYPSGPVTDPIGPATGTMRVVRGGSNCNPDVYCRPAKRFSLPPDQAERMIGFRICLSSQP